MPTGIGGCPHHNCCSLNTAVLLMRWPKALVHKPQAPEVCPSPCSYNSVGPSSQYSPHSGANVGKVVAHRLDACEPTVQSTPLHSKHRALSASKATTSLPQFLIPLRPFLGSDSPHPHLQRSSALGVSHCP